MIRMPSQREPQPSRPALTAPCVSTPILRPMVWGGRRLGERAGQDDCRTQQPYGESWEVSDHPSHRSVVAGGPLAGRSLRQLVQEHRVPLLGCRSRRYDRFPWLVKFLDAHDWLSVQVHPDDEPVRTLWPGEGGKTEVWFVLDELPGSRIYAGLMPGVDEAELRAALAAGTVAECLHSFKPRPGDCVFLPAGTVHAVGGGVLMAEVQQTSDATFRLFDWNRRDAQGKRRALHIEESLACIDWSQGPVTPIHVGAGVGSQALVKCPYFDLTYEVHETNRSAVRKGGTWKRCWSWKGAANWPPPLGRRAGDGGAGVGPSRRHGPDAVPAGHDAAGAPRGRTGPGVIRFSRFPRRGAVRIVLNRLSTLGQRTGIGHYTAELFRCLRAQAGADRIDSLPSGWLWQFGRWWYRLRTARRTRQGR